MKIVYLDQCVWIELSRASSGRGDLRGGAPDALRAIHKARETDAAHIPLSLGHYLETHKRRDHVQRARLAKFMLQVSGGTTVAPPHVVLRHEIELALQRHFPDRVKPAPFQFLGRGLTHAADHDFTLPTEWPPEASAIPAAQREIIQQIGQSFAEHVLLSGVLPTGQPLTTTPLTDLSPDRRFKSDLEEWRGAAKRHSPGELRRKIYARTLNDIKDEVFGVMRNHGVNVEEFAQLGEAEWCAFLDELPSRRADMHLSQQWAKNAALVPKDSDLNDWSYLGVAVCYCDVLVTEKHVADLFSRGLRERAVVLSNLERLPDALQ